MQINKFLLLRGCLPFAALAALTACVDDNYDLTDIDTTSRITVNNLTVPVNLEEIKLENVLDLDDNENISIVNGEYAIQKGGDINTSDFQINGIHVNAPVISSTHKEIPVNLGGLSGLGTTIPETSLPAIPLTDIPEQTYDLKLENVDAALVKLDDVKSKNPIGVEIILQIPSSIMTGNQVSFKDLTIKMPWGLLCNTSKLQSDYKGATYDSATGILKVSELKVGTDGKTSLQFEAAGIELGEKGQITDHRLNISGTVGIESGEIAMTVTNINIPNPFTLDVDYKVTSFDIASFSGDIDYKMDDINIDPISLSGLPDFLDSPNTEIRIAKPEININVNNPVGKYGLEGYGNIVLTSDFEGGNTTQATSDQFTIATNGANIRFDNGNFKGLGDILANDNAGGLPKDIKVSIKNLQFAGHAVDFPIGTIGKAQGDYNFTAPLGFADRSKVIYETTEAGWSSKDLDKLNIEYINLTAECTTDLPVEVQLTLQPVDKYGNAIPVSEDSGNFEVPPYCKGKEVSLKIQAANGTIHGFDGIRFIATIKQDSGNTGALSPDLFINLRNVRITVDGYYETDF